MIFQDRRSNTVTMRSEVKISNFVICNSITAFSTQKGSKRKINRGHFYNFSGLEVKQGSYEVGGQLEVKISNFFINYPIPEFSTPIGSKRKIMGVTIMTFQDWRSSRANMRSEVEWRSNLKLCHFDPIPMFSTSKCFKSKINGVTLMTFQD